MSASAITRETFFTTSIEILQEKMGSTEERHVILSLFHGRWIEKQSEKKLIEFAGRVFVIYPLVDPSNKPIRLLAQICTIKKLCGDSLCNFRRQVLEESYKHVNIESSHNYDLITLTCALGTVDDLLSALDTYEKAKGQKALKLYVRGRGKEILELVIRNNDFSNDARKILDYFHKKDLPAPPRLYNVNAC